MTALSFCGGVRKSFADRIEERGDVPLRDLLRDLGGWPVLDPNWDETAFDPTEVMAKLRLYNNRVLINQWVSSDDKNSGVNIIQVGIEEYHIC
jgi:membrane metallo-endopeptidase-like protein 1